MLEVTNLSVGYVNRPVLGGVSLNVNAGDVVALLGTNGAGKSTLMKCLAGTLRQSAGTVFIDGVDVSRSATWERTRKGIILVPEGQQSFPAMSVWENLWMGTQARPDLAARFDENISMVFDLFPRLAERRNQAAGSLSGGERQMLAVGRALIAQPRMLLLDEPSHGLAPLLVEQIAETIKVIAQTTAILVAEQNLVIPTRCATKVVVIENSKVVMTGNPEEILRSQFVVETYLGI